MEQGFKDIVVQEWLGWFVPAKTPAETVNKLNALVRESLQSPEFVESLARNSLHALTQSPKEFARLRRQDHERWAGIAKVTGFTTED